MSDLSPPVSIPRLRTKRLLLREYRMEDFDAFAANLADPLAAGFTGVHDRRTAWRIFGCNTGSWLLRGAGWWALEEHASGALVGQVGAFFRETSPEIEIGWMLIRAHWGRGLATEAVLAVVGHAFDVREEPRVTALIDPANAASLRVAGRVGFAFEEEAELFDKPMGRYAMARG